MKPERRVRRFLRHTNGALRRGGLAAAPTLWVRDHLDFVDDGDLVAGVLRFSISTMQRRGAFSEILSCSSPVIMLYTRVQGPGFEDSQPPRGRSGLGLEVPRLRGQGVLAGLRIRPSWTLQVRVRRDAFSPELVGLTCTITFRCIFRAAGYCSCKNKRSAAYASCMMWSVFPCIGERGKLKMIHRYFLG